MTQGVIYLAFGKPYLTMASLSYATLKKSNPGLPVTVVTNVSSDPLFDGWVAETDTWMFMGDDDDERNRLYKTRIIEWSSYDRTIYLDCDTLVVGDLSGLFKILEHADIALLTKDDGLSENQYGSIKILDATWALASLPHWNGGVVGFRDTPNARAFFTRWSEGFVALGHKRDQPSLAEAVLLSPARFLPFDSRWNMMSVERRDWSRPAVKVIHYVSEIDFMLARRLLQASKRMGEGGPREMTAFVRRRREFRRRKLGFLPHLIFKLRQSVRVALRPPRFWRELR